jgi:hypothetical protein
MPVRAVDTSVPQFFTFGAVTLALAVHSGANHRIVSHGVQLVVPAGWHQATSAPDAPVTDPRTVLVVGTGAVHTRWSQCQLTRYQIPAGGAVVVVVRWSSLRAAGGGKLRPGRWPLHSLRAVRPHTMECFPGRAAAADLLLGTHPYQVNVMVGALATPSVVRAALAVARSFDLTH